MAPTAVRRAASSTGPGRASLSLGGSALEKRGVPPVWSLSRWATARKSPPPTLAAQALAPPPLARREGLGPPLRRGLGSLALPRLHHLVLDVREGRHARGNLLGHADDDETARGLDHGRHATHGETEHRVLELLIAADSLEAVSARGGGVLHVEAELLRLGGEILGGQQRGTRLIGSTLAPPPPPPA